VPQSAIDTDINHFREGTDMIYAAPGSAEAKIKFKAQYDNFIGGKWVAPVKGAYFDVITPINGSVFTKAARSSAEDVELALDAAHAAADAWGKTSPTERSNLLLKIADRMEANLELLAYVETVDNGKPIRETLNADIPLAVDHFRYFAGCLRAQEGGISELDENTVAYHFHEPLGVVGQIIPWNFPILMAAWKLAPAIGAGNCVVLKPAESTPISILVLAELIADILPPGVLNIVNGYGREAGMPLATSKRIAKIAFTGSTTTGRVIAQAAANNLIPATLELGGKSPNIFFADIMDKDDGFLDKAIEGLVLFAFNQGEVCTCPSRALIQESIYDKFMERCLARVAAIKQGNPLDTDTMLGAQASKEQLTKILSYLDLGVQEGAEVLAGGAQADVGRRLQRRLLRAADPVQGPQQDAHLPGGNLRPGAGGDHLQGRSRSARNRQRHPVRPRRRRLEPQRQRRLPHGSRHQGRPRLDQLLPRLPGARDLRRLQGIRHRPRNPQGHARPLPADQEPAGQLRRAEAGFLLISNSVIPAQAGIQWNQQPGPRPAPG
jgi:aldehyde dehydrogenase